MDIELNRIPARARATEEEKILFLRWYNDGELWTFEEFVAAQGGPACRV